jgi:predicted transcriptional regulator of viral defense system
MKLSTFFYQHPVFTIQEFTEFLRQHGQKNLGTQRALLAYHKQKGHVVSLRRGLFAVVPPLIEPQHLSVDPYLIMGRVAEDATIAYHSALDLHGFAYSIYNNFYFLSGEHVRPFTIHGYSFNCFNYPKRLFESKQTGFGVETLDRQGMLLRVTNIERTLVDVLGKPALGGGWEELWRSLESLVVLNIDQVIEYALLLGNTTTIAKVGFFLEQQQMQLKVSNDQLQRLEAHLPRSKHYLDNTLRLPGKLVKRWQLIVPDAILNKTWEEPHVYL